MSEVSMSVVSNATRVKPTSVVWFSWALIGRLSSARNATDAAIRTNANSVRDAGFGSELNMPYFGESSSSRRVDCLTS